MPTCGLSVCMCVRVWQWLTFAWCVIWYVTKRLTTSLSISPGHPRPTVTSGEVKFTSLFIAICFIHQHLLLRKTHTSVPLSLCLSPTVPLSLLLSFPFLPLSLFHFLHPPPPPPTPGRAGRVSKGFCYRLVTRTFWNSEIPEYTVPEMLVRTTLSQVMVPAAQGVATPHCG